MSEELEKAKGLAEELWWVGQRGKQDAAARLRKTFARKLDILAANLSEAEQAYLNHYATCLSEGCEPSIADMLASRKGPALVTDAVFMEGSGCGKKYLSGLAAYPDDPEAMVSSRGDVERVLKERGWGAEGMVNVQPKVKPPRRERAMSKVKPLKQRLAENLGKAGYRARFTASGGVGIEE